MSARFRQLVPVGLVLVLTVVGFFVARALGELDARRDSNHRAEIAATRVRDRVAQASTVVDGVRRFLSGHVSASVTTKQFADIGALWLSPVGLPAAAWVEPVSPQERATYERRTGHRIVASTSSGGLARAGSRKSYLPATLVTGVPPLSAPGLDLGGIPEVAAAVARPHTAYRVSATALGQFPDGTSGLFLVQSAQRLDRGVVEPGFAVLFLPASWLLAAAADTVESNPTPNPNVQITVGSGSAGDLHGTATARSTFAAAGQPFEVRVPRRPVQGAGAVFPWIVLAAGLMLAALAGALSVIAARRAKAKAEVDRLFTISPDLIVVAGFDGYFKRVNPAFSTLLGYTEREVLTRPYIEFIHPDDRERSIAKRAEIREGETTVSFQNRYVCKDGSWRWIEWTAAPVLEERLSYAVGRDVTERRQAESEVARLAEEQAALRRVATLVARGTPPEELFAAVTKEVGQLLPVGSAAMGRYDSDGMFTTVAAWSKAAVAFPVGQRWIPEGKNVMTIVFETGRSARIDDFADASGPVGVAAREAGYRSAVGTPIVVEDRLWGVMTAASSEQRLASDTEARLASFTELVATAIANAENRAGLTRLAEEQAALRRVATLIVEGVRPAEIFAAVSAEVGRLFDSGAAVLRFEHDGPAIVLAGTYSRDEDVQIPIGTRWELEDGMAAAEVYRTGRSARADTIDLSPANGPAVAAVHRLGVVSIVASPIVVEGRLWGAITLPSREQLPLDTEERLEKFTELVATAIANAESRAGLARLAEEQAALRRVATLVAGGAPPSEVFAATAAEIRRLLDSDYASLARYEPDGTLMTLAHDDDGDSDRDAAFVGKRHSMDGESASGVVFRTGRTARISFDTATGPVADLARSLGVKASVGVPIVVEGRLWGVIVVSTKDVPLPADTERRLADFTELLATGIADAESRAALGRLASQQAALRRVATLAVEGVPPAGVFSALCDEVNQLLDAQTSTIVRCEADGTVTVVASAGATTKELTVGTRTKPAPGMVALSVIETGRPARKDDYDNPSGRPAGVARGLRVARALGIRSTVGVPIAVEGALWGVFIIGTVREHFADDTGQRLEEFTELAATAIANAESRSELAASRARIVAASDETRRRIERDLHDGTQQRLVSLALALRATEAKVPDELDEVRAELSVTANGLAAAVEDLQEISRGIHPAILSRGGLVPALETLAQRAAVPVQLAARMDTKLTESVEVAAYYVVSEALTNVAKHADATHVQIELTADDSALELAIRDDGVGGADPAAGSGLIGLRDRVEALGGTLETFSSSGIGTSLLARIPTDQVDSFPEVRPAGRSDSADAGARTKTSTPVS